MSGSPLFPENVPPMIRQAFGQVHLAPAPQIVFNGYNNGHTASEMTSILSFSDRIVGVLVMPPVVAKSFALALLETVEGYEKATGQTIETLEVLTERMTAYMEKAVK